MPLIAHVDTDNTSIIVEYDLDWVLEVMRVSSVSMVPFTYFTECAPVKTPAPREYPRSSHSPFTLGLPKSMFKSKEEVVEPEVSNSSASGGREPAQNPYAVEELCELMGAPDRRVPLSDIAILSKRALCQNVGRNGFRHFTVSGGDDLPTNHPGSMGIPIYGYPMLCVIGNNTTTFPKDQSEWRAVQCLFGAVLTGEIRKAEIGLEVVSREGFGSLFPTLADLPDGIRLDPGLLPPDRGPVAIRVALQMIDAIIHLDPTVPKSIAKLGGFSEEALRQVDNLMSWLHDFTFVNPEALAADYVERLLAFTGKSGKMALPMIGGGVGYGITGAVDFGNKKKARVIERKEPKYSGYGSDSEYEDDDDDPPVQIEDNDAPVVIDGKFALKKYSVVTGMAALRMATLYAMAYSAWLFTKGGLEGVAMETPALESKVQAWAPYFELNYDKLFAKLAGATLAGVHVLLFDGAPNPINIPSDGGQAITEPLGAIVIDATNITSREKAGYLINLQSLLATPTGPKGRGGIILLVDSVSKHPTGGDLVHGVMRVYGSLSSLKTFDGGFMQPHLKARGESARSQTVLTDGETTMRRLMLETRLVMRNKDVAQWLVKK